MTATLTRAFHNRWPSVFFNAGRRPVLVRLTCGAGAEKRLMATIIAAPLTPCYIDFSEAILYRRRTSVLAVEIGGAATFNVDGTVSYPGPPTRLKLRRASPKQDQTQGSPA